MLPQAKNQPSSPVEAREPAGEYPAHIRRLPLPPSSTPSLIIILFLRPLLLLLSPHIWTAIFLRTLLLLLSPHMWTAKGRRDWAGESQCLWVCRQMLPQAKNQPSTPLEARETRRGVPSPHPQGPSTAVLVAVVDHNTILMPPRAIVITTHMHSKGET